MVEAAKEVNAIHEQLELIKEADRTAQLEAAYSQNPILLALGNVFRAYDWLKPYQPIDLTYATLQQIIQQQTPQYAYN